MNPKLRLAKMDDLRIYTHLLQKTYQSTFTNDAIGLTADCYSLEVFFSPYQQRRFAANLEVNAHQKTWLAFIQQDLVGSVTMTDLGQEYMLKGFYVSPTHQGHGIGKLLWSQALTFTKGKEIVLNTLTNNYKAIGIYTKWGFVIDTQKGTFTYHWPEWPEGVHTTLLHMRYTPKTTANI